MNPTKIDLNFADLHTHTIASDGEMTAGEIIEAAGGIGLKTISITDHDGVGAYTGKVRELKKSANSFGVDLITGIELDSEYNGVEVHILGYGIDIENPRLKKHLIEVQTLRTKRIREIMNKVNLNLGKDFLTEDMIFPPGRETLMKPHIIRELLDKKKFKKYKDASKWIDDKCKPETTVPKFFSGVIIPIILEAGGTPVLAHPAYYMGQNGIDIETMIAELSTFGLKGIEVYYNYHGFSPANSDMKGYPDLIFMLLDISKKHDLFATRGSDSHTMNDFMKRNPPEKIK